MARQSEDQWKGKGCRIMREMKMMRRIFKKKREEEKGSSFEIRGGNKRQEIN